MKKISILSILLCLSGILYAQSESDSLILKKIDSILNVSANGSLTAEQKAAIRSLGYIIQNRGFELEEYQRDYEGAMIKINKALRIWIISCDTVNEANNLKYRGYLYGKLNKFSEGKTDISSAIGLFSTQGNSNGVTVSKYDLAKIYEYEGKLDSALYFSDLVKRYWYNVNDTFRIVTVNNEMMNLYCMKKEYRKAKTIQIESDSLIIQNDLHWTPLIDFYYLSALTYKNLGDQKAFLHFDGLYNRKIKELQSEDPNTRSNYSF